MQTRSIVPRVAAGAFGGAVAIGLMLLLSEYAAYPLMVVPFATSIVLVMGTPDAEPAQPRALVGGHLIATAVGLLVLQLTGPSPWGAAAAVGLAMVAMHLSRAFHPPAGIDPLVVVIHDMSWSFLFIPVAAGAILLALFTWSWHNVAGRGGWPLRWR